MANFIHIRSAKFPILPGEEDELVNEGTYGKALAEYVQTGLRNRGYDAPFICCEDWGWWVELKTAPFTFGVCIYSGSRDSDAVDFICTHNAHGPRKRSWKKLRFAATGPHVERLMTDLVSMFADDSEIECFGHVDDFADAMFR